jgi:hypothetical protein
MSEENVEYLPTPTLYGNRATKYKSNPNFEAVRQGVVALLNSYDPETSVVDNYEVVRTASIAAIEHIIEDGKKVLEQYREQNLTNNANRQEDYLKGCYACLENVKLYL